MLKILGLCNALINVILMVVVIVLWTHMRTGPSDQDPTSRNLIRTNQLEITDSKGSVRARLGLAEDDSPVLSLIDQKGRDAILMTVNHLGYGTIYFQDKRFEGRLSMGYLWGSDTQYPKDFEDPLSSWGIRIRSANGIAQSCGFSNTNEKLDTSFLSSCFSQKVAVICPHPTHAIIKACRPPN